MRGRISCNNADIISPAVFGGQGLALQPEFIVWDALKSGELEAVLPEWRIADVSINLVTPPGQLRPARVTALLDFLTENLATAPWAQKAT
ncbi:LysR substrate binding domain protein [compost metagenome]